MELTTEEKRAIVEQHMKNIAYSDYNLYISLLEAEASEDKNQSTIDSINQQILNNTAQKAALQAELDSLTA